MLFSGQGICLTFQGGAGTLIHSVNTLEVILELISHTTTQEGLTVTAIKDSNTYPTGIKVSDKELAALNLSRESFHGEWNYTIKPQEF